MAEIRMPKMGDGMVEGTITAWLKREGDAIREGDFIATVETDKTNVEIPAEESGTLTQIVVPVGQTVLVGAVIAQVQTSAGETTRPAAPAEPAGVDTRRAAASEAVGRGYTAASGEPNGHEPAVLQGETPSAERIKASPLARRMAEEHGYDLARIRGTGPGGRIVERDVAAFRAAQQAAPAVVATPVYAPRPTPEMGLPIAREIQPTKMRAAIARRTLNSVQNVPHFYLTMVIEMDRSLNLLKELNADTKDGKITINDLLIKACAVALGSVPEANAAWTPEGTIRQFSEAHIGIVVAISDGLIIPVLRDCHRKTLRQISQDARELIKKARENQLKPQECSGGTFSISNLGATGTEWFTAIINSPEAAILAVGGINREPVVAQDSDNITIRSRMRVTLSSDHRVLDGVLSARFAGEIKRLLEAPYSLLA